MANIVTNDGLNVAINRTFKSSPDYTLPDKVVFSTNTLSPAATDSTMYGVLSTSYTAIDSMDSTASWTATLDAGTVVLNTTAGQYREGTGCLNLPVTYSTGTARWEKTISSADVSASFIGFWLYLDATTYLASGTDTVRIILGTGGYTDANYYDTGKTSLQAGWNYIVFNATAYTSQAGSGATLSGVDSIAIQVKTTNDFASNSMRADFIFSFLAADRIISVTAGYPTFNEANNTTTLRHIIEATQGNDGTPDIWKIYLINSDSTATVFSESLLSNEISKTDKTRLTINTTIQANQG